MQVFFIFKSRFFTRQRKPEPKSGLICLLLHHSGCVWGQNSGRFAGPGEHGRLGRLHRRPADEAVRKEAPREAHDATREGARAPRDRRDSDARSLCAWGRRYHSVIAAFHTNVSMHSGFTKIPDR